MWSDNEASIDLLGFAPYAKTVADLVRDESLLPLTVGIFGDWGSGKSSLMMQVQDAVKAEDVAVVTFQPWLHKDYDDVKSALMVAILDALDARKSGLEKAKDATVDAAKKGLQSLAKRIDWLRAIGYLGRAGAGVMSTLAGNPLGVLGVIGTVSDAGDALAKGEFIKEEAGSKISFTDAPVERGISEFRKDFADLIVTLKLKALIVLVDDIDRCLPATIIDVLEAIRLFFAVPKTAFVIGADERIIRHALSTKYPEAPELQIDLGRDYLEKIIQVPVAVPKLTSSDVQGYLHLLVLQLHLASTDASTFKAICEKALEARKTTGAAVTMNYGIAQPFIKNNAELDHDLAAIGKIAPVLARFLNGRPRQAKRFLNTLYLRRSLAKQIGITVDFAVLAKLTVAEYFDPGLYRKLYETRDKDGIVSDIAAVEDFAKTSKGKYEGDFAAFIGRERIKHWFASEPSLAKVDLGPYFTLAKERLTLAASGAQLLPENLQNIMARLADASQAVQETAIDDAKALAPHEIGMLFASLGDATRLNVSAQNMLSLVDVAALSAPLATELASVLGDVPVDGIPITVATRIQLKCFDGKQPTGVLAALLEKWAAQDTNKKLAVAAKSALQSGKK
jgi:hypothetical protein